MSNIDKSSAALGPSAKVLFIAWCVEGACVGIGLLIAIIIGFEAGGTWAGIMAGVPFAAAAVVELARIPLVRSCFAVRGPLFKALALAAILLAGALTVENLIFGFERAFTVRIEDVRQKSQEAVDAKAEVARLDGSRTQTLAQRVATETEIKQLIEQQNTARSTASAVDARAREAGSQEYNATMAQAAAAERERTAMQARHRTEQASAAAVCKATPEHCAMGATQRRQQLEIAAADRRVAEARQQIQRLGDAERQERSQSRGRVESDLQDLRNRQVPLEARLAELNKDADDTQARLDKATLVANNAYAIAEAVQGKSQMHRLAKFFFNADDNAAAMRTLAWFSIVAAIVLSSTGSILAATHFRTLTQPMVERPNQLARAVRGWIARQRRKHSVVKKVEVVREVEVPVERVVERKVEVHVPVDRIVVREVEVVKPEVVLVPVPLEATEAARRDIMERAARSNTAVKQAAA